MAPKVGFRSDVTYFGFPKEPFRKQFLRLVFFSHSKKCWVIST